MCASVCFLLANRDSRLVTIVGLPPKDPPDDDDENEQDEENDEEDNEDEEPAVVEPDEC